MPAEKSKENRERLGEISGSDYTAFYPRRL
jgi:hypothetical protein